MSIHKSFKRERFGGNRTVFTRLERIKLLIDQKKWIKGDKVFSLPKVKIVKLKKIKVDKKETEKELGDRT